MPEVELEPDRNRLYELVRLTWDGAQVSAGDDKPVTDREIADAGPYSVEQIREHLESERDSTYSIDRDGENLRVLTVHDRW